MNEIVVITEDDVKSGRELGVLDNLRVNTVILVSHSILSALRMLRENAMSAVDAADNKTLVQTAIESELRQMESIIASEIGEVRHITASKFDDAEYTISEGSHANQERTDDTGPRLGKLGEDHPDASSTRS